VLEPLAGDALLAEVEALLFASERPISVGELLRVLPEPQPERDDVLACLDLLVRRHDEAPGRGFVLVEVEERFQFRTTAATAESVGRLSGLRPVKLSRAALEALAIVAYKQPVTRGEVERVRGVDSGGVLRALLQRRLLRVAGRRDEPGRPIVYATSQDFLDTFGLGSLDGLPSLREFTQLGDEDIEAVADLLTDPGDLKKQVTFDEYAARVARDEVDARVDERLAERRPPDPEAAPEPAPESTP
jgi:segregation and condensation protein B